MALGTITPRTIDPTGAPAGTPMVLGAIKMTVTDVVMDTSYPTGGSALSAAQLGLTRVLFAISEVSVVGAGGMTEVHYSVSTNKLKAFTGTAEVANTTDLSANTVQVVAFGY